MIKLTIFAMTASFIAGAMVPEEVVVSTSPVVPTLSEFIDEGERSEFNRFLDRF